MKQYSRMQNIWNSATILWLHCVQQRISAPILIAFAAFWMFYEFFSYFFIQLHCCLWHFGRGKNIFVDIYARMASTTNIHSTYNTADQSLWNEYGKKILFAFFSLFLSMLTFLWFFSSSAHGRLFFSIISAFFSFSHTRDKTITVIMKMIPTEYFCNKRHILHVICDIRKK